MKRANGMGTICKLSGNRRRPWAIKRVVGWKDNGNPIIKYQGYYRTRREAETALNEYNNDPYAISNKTLGDLYKEWYDKRSAEKSDNTLKNYRTAWSHLAPLSYIKIKDIDRAMLQQFYDDLNVSENTFRKVTQLVGMLFDYAARRGMLSQSMIQINRTLEMPSKAPSHNKARSAISYDDINRLWGMIDNEYVKIALVFIYTGLRFSELYELTPDCCHDNYIEIKQAKTPAGVRIVPICDKIKAILPIIDVPPRTTYARRFEKFLPDHYIHDTRHTFITMLTEKGVDARVIKAIVGHKSNDVTDVYTHISLDVMLEAVNRL